MEVEKSTQLLNDELLNDIECRSSDVIQIDADVNEFIGYDEDLATDLYDEEEILEVNPSKAMEEFSHRFADQYSTSGPALYMGSLDQALAHSLFDPINPCPLVLLIYHNQSIAAHVFCEQVLCTDRIKKYLAENFIVWVWDRTIDMNYQCLLTALRTHAGDEVVETVASLPIDRHPMLVCLEFNSGYVEVVAVIQGVMSSDETLTLLMKAHDIFDRRIEAPCPTSLSLTAVSNEGWSMSSSVLVPINRKSKEFEKIANEFVGRHQPVITIDKIENSLWLFQYLNQKKKINAQLTNDENERLLVFYCSQLIVEEIFHSGFKDHLKSPQDRTYGHGFYFSLPSVHSHPYLSSTDNNQTMLVCRVLVGRTCLGNSTMETCPDGYDSTTNGSNIYVVYSNRSISPKYKIKQSD